VKKINEYKTIFRSLKYRNYRIFFAGQILSLIGTWMQQIALPWLVYQLTGSVKLLGVVAFAGQIPILLLAPYAGVMADRWNRYHILLITQTLSMLQAFVLGFLYIYGNIQIWQIIPLALFLGVINAFDMPTRQAFVADMVDNREDLNNAIALNSMMFNSARLIGPTIAGILIAAFNEGVCFIINAVSFLCVITSLLFMKISPPQAKPQINPVIQELKAGFTYAFGFKPIKYIILLLSLVSLVGMPYVILMPVFTDKILHGGPHTYGFLMASAGTGALTGTFYLASRKSVRGLSKIIPLSAAIFGAGLVAFSFSKLLWLSLPLMFIAGLGIITQIAASNIIIQTIVDDDKRGRIMSFYVIAVIGTAPFGSLIAGFLAGAIGTPDTLFIGGCSCLLGAAIFARKLPEIRKHIRPIYVRLGIVREVSAGLQAASNLTTPPER
jgi:MFS family permease